MATKMLMPLLGQTMEEGTIIQWFRNEGESINKGEPLLEVMTDKVNMEVESPESGVLRKIIAQPEEVIPVKEPICIIGKADESIDALMAEVPAKPAEAAAPAPTAQAAPAAAPAEAPAAPVAVPAIEGRIIASPAARRVAREHGIELAALAGRGTGPGGRIVEKDITDYLAAQPKLTPLAGKIAADLGVSAAGVVGTGVAGKITSEDVRRAAERAPAAAAPAIPLGATIPFTGMRKMVAKNVFASYSEAVHVALVAEVDMTECVRMRNQLLPEFESKYGVRISFTDIIAKATARAILDKPIVNSSLVEDKIVIHDRINMGIATAIEGGLVVPVVKDIVSKPLQQVSLEIKELVARVRSGAATAEDFKGGTFTITNLGPYGIDSFHPIITPGQSAILGIGRIVEKPAVVEGRIEIRSMMNLCLTFDHRVMDGAPAAEYLARLRQILESPYLLFV